ncbi:uncharacterized protein LOC114515663 isoform X2 [Dendronephthya gigantea]|uniref:uncharacterized protein LOC114515663 isoform X2 n=1 Tax=Dendronephthya gigantea TaxID=151771 RepID=UPI0010690224|nr:uncharacterized protein LOC114515663 isoform X2 [Dendronephthya gigantea]
MAEAIESNHVDHIVMFSRKCLLDINDKQKAEVESIADSLKENFQLCYISHQFKYEEQEALPERIRENFKKRDDELPPFIRDSSNSGSTVIIIGAVNEDLYLAAHTKSFLIGASWVELEDKVITYGIPAPTPNAAKVILEIIANQSEWYYTCEFIVSDVPTKVVALCSANTYGPPSNEKEIAKKFQAVLKDGDKNAATKKALLCYLMAAIAHDNDFREVQDWAIAPSSSTDVNETMVELKEHLRYMMYGRKKDPIFVRHEETTKSRYDKYGERVRDDYCQKHFRSIKVHQSYKTKLKGRVVCVIDDYLTHGNTFEALRNLLIKCEVKKIIFVAIGKFLRSDEGNYITKSFSIEGDVFTSDYQATFQEKKSHQRWINLSAKRSQQELNKLANSLGY